jgi:hypothetical protein
MGYFKELDITIKESLAKPDGQKLTKNDLIIRLHHAHRSARLATQTAETTAESEDKKQLLKIGATYLEIAEKYFLRLIK